MKWFGMSETPSESDDRFILALDQGTSSSRAILFDKAGEIQGISQKEFRQYFPHPGWVEQDPVEIWSAQLGVLQQVVAEAGISAQSIHRIAAVGITNQRETTVVWEKATGQPIYPAIVWQDCRTADRCESLRRSGAESLFREKTGLLLDPYFSGTKLQWILDNVSGARTRARKGELLFGTIDSWLIWKLTGGARHVTDVTNASRTQLFNIHTLAWDDELLDRLEIPREVLPEVKSCSEVIGSVVESVLPGKLPIAGIAGDQQAALFGQACFRKGMAKNTYGTGCFLLMNIGEQPILSENNLLTTIAWQINGRTEYALEGSVFVGGAVIQWLRDELGVIGSASECDTLAATVPDSAGCFLVPAFGGLGAPHWDPYARGSLLGLTRGTNRAHLCRAALESIAFQSHELIRAMERDAQLRLHQLRVDGGASRSDLLMQIQSNLLQSTVVRAHCSETTALGAAYLAGLAVGFWSEKSDVFSNWKQAGQFAPNCTEAEIRPLCEGWNRAVQRSKHWVPEKE